MIAGRSPQVVKTKVLRDKRFSEEKISMKGTSVEQIYLHSAVNEAAMVSYQLSKITNPSNLKTFYSPRLPLTDARPRLFSPLEPVSTKLQMKAQKLHEVNLELSPDLRPLKAVIPNKILNDSRKT
jgi:hypothetical protein